VASPPISATSATASSYDPVRKCAFAPENSSRQSSTPAYEADRLRAILRYARIPRESAAEFWDRVFALVNDFSRLPRTGETVYGFVAGLYPTEHPTLPEPDGGGPA
jgi:hypothetical protein